MTLHRDQTGSATLEILLLLPIIAVFVAAILVVGRAQAGHADVDAAARAAARDLTLTRDPQAAIPTARDRAAEILNVGSRTCRTMDFHPQLDTDSITVEISCTVDLSDTTILPVPGTAKVKGTATERIDSWRE